MKHENALANLGCLLANAASLHFLMVIFLKDLPDPLDRNGIVIWWASLTVFYIGLWLLLRFTKGDRRGALALVALCGLAQGAANWRWGVVSAFGIMGWLWTAALWGITYYRGCSLLLEPARPEARMMDFETTVIMLFVATVLTASGVYDSAVLVPLVLGVAFALVGMAQQRTARGRNHAPFWVMAIPLGAVGLGALFVMFLAGPLAGLIKAVVYGVIAVVEWLGRALLWVIEWLVSLLPMAEQAPVELPPPAFHIASGEAAGGEDVSGMMATIGLVLVVALGAAALAWLILRGPHRLPGEGRPAERRGPGFRQWLRAVLAEIMVRLRFWRRSVLGRDTAPGLFIWLEKRLKRRGYGRRKGETCRAFLERAGLLLPACAAELAELSDTLDALYYGGTKEKLPAARVRAARKALQRELNALPLLALQKKSEVPHV